MEPLVFLILIGLGALYWQGAIRDRESALRSARTACQRHDVQFLDGSVCLIRTRPARSERGLCFRRRYRFEFSVDGGNRRFGELELLCGRTRSLTLALNEFTLYESDPDGDSNGTHTLH